MVGPSRTNVIERSYLGGLILKCGAFFAAGLVVVGIILFYTTHQPLGPSYQESFSNLVQLKQEILTKSVFIYSFLTLVVLIAIVFTTTLYSHRVVGPMVGLKRVFSLLKKGDLSTPAVLRSKDAIKPMADALNTMIGTQKSCIKNLQTNTTTLRQQLEANKIESVQKSALAIKAQVRQIKLS